MAWHFVGVESACIISVLEDEQGHKNVFLPTRIPASIPAVLSQSHVTGLVVHPEMDSVLLPAYSGETGPCVSDGESSPSGPRIAIAILLDLIRVRLCSSVRYVTLK